MLSRSACRISRKLSYARALSTQSAPQIQNSVFVSHSSDPLFNLSFEDWLFRHSPPDKSLLFLYRNSPCVVIGRNQNPWKEVNMRALRERDVPLVRRRSGGGTVYHDMGNTNFSIHLARRAFDRRTTAALVLRAVQSLGIPRARLNDRNDLCVGEDKMSPAPTAVLTAGHVSGSAYKIVNTRAYHHGTMLIATQLDALGDLLRAETVCRQLRPVSQETMVTAGVASVRSPVCNLQQSTPHIEHSVFARAVEREFRREYTIDEKVDPTQLIDQSTSTGSYIENGITELKSWDWLYGQTPEFTYTISETFAWGSVTAKVRAKHAIILSCTVDAPDAPPHISRALDALGTEAEGQRYGHWLQAVDGDVARDQDGDEKDRNMHDNEVTEVEGWLRLMLR
ncbi:Lipoyltransferase and lipoate-protein ligase [Mycena metata]|uniref:Putative lipoate-protein ligase A n=1 Tax=Mycena metata TaxID=1033252 RepID=A0AAD7NE15_9AGAR|nr:Lipoyltransferase and lipoate-protein ligase [Mycena metata]